MDLIESTESDSLYSTGSAPIESPAEAAALDRAALVRVSNDQRAVRAAMTPPAVPRMEKRSVPDDDDAATAATVAMMCDYIRQSVDDPICKMWAAHAKACYAGGANTGRALFWGVFWLLKHSVRYQKDESELFKIGQGDARDLLTSPAVLVRQPSPAEDCDGFTMLACTLLEILGIRSYIATVAVDPSDPSRWSHVFALADVPGVGICALDGSHGKMPGWMVPRSHIFKAQVWDLNGSRVRMDLPGAASRLRGYFPSRGRGMGDALDDEIAALPVGNTTLDTMPLYWPSSSSGGGGGFDLSALISSLVGTAGKVATVAVAPQGSVITPSGMVTTPGAIAASSLSGMIPLLLIGGVIILGVSMAKGGK